MKVRILLPYHLGQSKFILIFFYLRILETAKYTTVLNARLAKIAVVKQRAT
jgi:hypothetical protein